MKSKTVLMLWMVMGFAGSASADENCASCLVDAGFGDFDATQACIYDHSQQFQRCAIALSKAGVSDYYALQGCLYDSSLRFQRCVAESEQHGIDDYLAVQGCLDTDGN